MSRAMLAARSALLRWSAVTISILRPSTSPPKSSAAIFAAASLPGPVMSAYRPDMSRMPPSFSGGLPCANAPVAANARPNANTVETTRFMKASLCACRIDCGLLFDCRDHAACACQRQAAGAKRQKCAIQREHFPQSGMIFPQPPARAKQQGYSRQKSLSGNVVELQSDAIGILEQQRIISWRPLIFARRANDLCAERT